MAGYDIEISLKLANLAAGIVAKKMFGAAQASIDEVISSL
jgi:bifunctional ADP-heptose synthase (sugar kinase/adenylyltransferase)